MPISLPPISRRRFLGGSLAAGLGLVFRHPLLAADGGADPHRFALLSDPHIAADPKTISRGVNMTDHFNQVRDELLKLDKKPAAVLIDGDCAFTTGEAADYANLVGLLKPLREHGLPIHLTLGNHDNRENFWQAIPSDHKLPVKDRHTMILTSERANWFILDSLDKTNSTPGICGADQLTWLGKALDAQADKPALVMVHHDPNLKAPDPKATGPKPKKAGLIDSEALMEVIRPRKQVKVLFFGHTHTWNVQKRDEIHFVNFPPVGYVFKEGFPSGWVDARLGNGGMTIELRSIDTKHRHHGEKHELTYRA